MKDVNFCLRKWGYYTREAGRIVLDGYLWARGMAIELSALTDEIVELNGEQFQRGKAL